MGGNEHAPRQARRPGPAARRRRPRCGLRRRPRPRRPARRGGPATRRRCPSPRGRRTPALRRGARLSRLRLLPPLWLLAALIAVTGSIAAVDQAKGTATVTTPGGPLTLTPSGRR